MTVTSPATSAVGELGAADTAVRWLAQVCRWVDVLICWKVRQERRSASRFHQRRRQARRRRRQRADRRRAMLSMLTRAWRR